MFRVFLPITSHLATILEKVSLPFSPTPTSTRNWPVPGHHFLGTNRQCLDNFIKASNFVFYTNIYYARPWTSSIWPKQPVPDSGLHFALIINSIPREYLRWWKGGVEGVSSSLPKLLRKHSKDSPYPISMAYFLFCIISFFYHRMHACARVAKPLKLSMSSMNSSAKQEASCPVFSACGLE
jgi:hypothetical protein